MYLGIDHLVIAVADPDAAAATMEADLGLAVTGGGRHETGGTWNRLAFLGDTYLELIGVFDRELVRTSPGAVIGRAALELLDEGREGLATWSIATDDIAGDVAALRARGSSISEPVTGSRRRADGEDIRWTCAFPQLGPGGPPFLIEHEALGAEWGVEARAARAAFRHPVGGAVRLDTLRLPVVDPQATARTCESTVGLVFDDDGRTTVSGQQVRLVAHEAGRAPIVELLAEVGAEPIDAVRFGVRWVRRSGEPSRRTGAVTQGAVRPAREVMIRHGVPVADAR